MNLVIRKKDITKLGKDLIKEVHKTLNNDYFKETFPEEIDKTSKSFYNYLTDRLFCKCKDNVLYNFLPETSPEENLNNLITMIECERLDNDLIFDTLSKLDLEIELNEDLYFKIKSFLNLYSVFYHDYSYLEN